MHPSQPFKPLKIYNKFLENDKIEIAFNKAALVVQRAHEPGKHEGDRNPKYGEFEIRLGRNGIVGARGLF